MEKNPLQVEVYESQAGWEWRMWRSGRVLAQSPEAYKTKARCKRTLTRLLTTLAHGAYIWRPL